MWSCSRNYWFDPVLWAFASKTARATVYTKQCTFYLQIVSAEWIQVGVEEILKCFTQLDFSYNSNLVFSPNMNNCVQCVIYNYIKRKKERVSLKLNSGCCSLGHADFKKEKVYPASWEWTLPGSKSQPHSTQEEH